jgi:large subunit ribosomal protein L20
VKKRDIRKLWIQRINAGVRMYNIFPYSRFINNLQKNDVKLNRKVLADIAVTEPLSFRSVLEVAAAKI